MCAIPLFFPSVCMLMQCLPQPLSLRTSPNISLLCCSFELVQFSTLNARPSSTSPLASQPVPQQYLDGSPITILTVPAFLVADVGYHGKWASEASTSCRKALGGSVLGGIRWKVKMKTSWRQQISQVPVIEDLS